MDSRLKLLQATELYLEKYKYMRAFKCLCEDYASKSQILYPFEIMVNLMDLLEENAILGHIVLKEPLQSQQLFQEVIYETVTRQNWLRLENIGQLLVTICIVTLPPFPEFDISGIHDLLIKYGKKGYYRFDGVITSLSLPSKYTLAACYKCSNRMCPGSTGNRFTRIHVAGAKEKQTVSDNFKCILCGNNLQENVKARLVADKVVVEMLPLNAVFQAKKLVTCVQAIPVYFRGSFTDKINIGHCYRLIAMPICKYHLGSSCEPCSMLALEANYVENWIGDAYQKNDWFMKSFKANMLQLLSELHLLDFADSAYILLLLLAFSFAGYYLTLA